MEKQANCYCGAATSFDACCRLLIDQKLMPKTAEQLMRSRFSAFCTNHASYLVNTHWPITPNSQAQIQHTINTTQWIGLKIIKTKKGQQTDTDGIVEFVAFFDDHGVAQLHEESKFEKHDGKWFYTNGKHLPSIKIGRNDPCICGSGKKYKKCHFSE